MPSGRSWPTLPSMKDQRHSQRDGPWWLVPAYIVALFVVMVIISWFR